jgi:uncharacterized membrane protein YcaP (DUF421 family)
VAVRDRLAGAVRARDVDLGDDRARHARLPVPVIVLRFFLKRQAGALGISDLLVVVLLADAAQNAMGADYRSAPEGAALILTIVFWDYALDWLAFRFPAFERVVRPRPLLLIRNGRLQRRNIAREKVTDEELESQLRHHGLDSPAEVREAFMEADGRLSVVKRAKEEGGEDAKEQEEKRKVDASVRQRGASLVGRIRCHASPSFGGHIASTQWTIWAER